MARRRKHSADTHTHTRTHRHTHTHCEMECTAVDWCKRPTRHRPPPPPPPPSRATTNQLAIHQIMRPPPRLRSNRRSAGGRGGWWRPDFVHSTAIFFFPLAATRNGVGQSKTRPSASGSRRHSSSTLSRPTRRHLHVVVVSQMALPAVHPK